MPPELYLLVLHATSFGTAGTLFITETCCQL